jgi:hypothetical protein
MIDTLSQDQKVVWIKDPVQDIIKSMTLSVVCIGFCGVLPCKNNCIRECTIYFE